MFFLILLFPALTTSQIERGVVDRCYRSDCTLTFPICIADRCREREFIDGDVFFDLPVNRSYHVKLHLAEMYRLDEHASLQKLPVETPFVVMYHHEYCGEILVLITTTGMKFVLHFHGVSEYGLVSTTVSTKETSTPMATSCVSKDTSPKYYAYVACILGGLVSSYLLYRVLRCFFTTRRTDHDIVLVNLDGVNETLL